MIIKDQTDFTSDGMNSPGRGSLQLHITGPGPVTIEFQGADGVYRGFPESTFAGPTAKVVSMPPVLYRVVIKGGPTTVELFP